MFDISFFEILLISVVALLVLGPERLPGAIRTAGLWIGRLKRSFNNVKRDIEKEIGADEIRRQLRNEAIMEKFDSTKSQFTKTIESVKSQAESVKKNLDVSSQLNDVKKDLDLTKQFDAVAGKATKETAAEAGSATKKAETSATANKIAAPSEKASEPASEAPTKTQDKPAEQK